MLVTETKRASITIWVVWLTKFSPTWMYVDTIIIDAITAFGFRNWKINVSINFTGFLFLFPWFFELEKDILYAR